MGREAEICHFPFCPGIHRVCPFMISSTLSKDKRQQERAFQLKTWGSDRRWKRYSRWHSTVRKVEWRDPGGWEGGDGLPYEKVGDAHREFLFWLLRGTKKGVVQGFFDPCKVPGTGANGIGSARFVIKTLFCRGNAERVHFTDAGGSWRFRVSVRMLLSDV